MVPKVINNLFWHLGWWSTFNKWLEAICQFFVSQNNGFFPASKLKVRINDFLPSLFLPFLSHGFKVLVAFAFKNHLWGVYHSWISWQTYLSEVILYWKCMRVFKMHNLHFKVMCTCHQVFIVELHIIYNSKDKSFIYQWAHLLLELDDRTCFKKYWCQFDFWVS